jgi:hypothetical protein
MRNKTPTIISIVALVFAMGAVANAARVYITGANIKNNTISTRDLHNGGVNSVDLHNNGVTSEDLAPESVEEEALSLPEPEETTPNTLNAAVSSEFGRMGTVATYQKEEPDSVVVVSLSGAVVSGPATNCVFQLRINGQQAQAGGGEVFAGSQAVNVSTEALFTGLSAGPVEVEIWGRASLFVPGGGPTGPTCIVGPANPGIDTTVIVSEEVG